MTPCGSWPRHGASSRREKCSDSDSGSGDLTIVGVRLSPTALFLDTCERICESRIADPRTRESHGSSRLIGRPSGGRVLRPCVRPGHQEPKQREHHQPRSRHRRPLRAGTLSTSDRLSVSIRLTPRGPGDYMPLGRRGRACGRGGDEWRRSETLGIGWGWRSLAWWRPVAISRKRPRSRCRCAPGRSWRRATRPFSDSRNPGAWAVTQGTIPSPTTSAEHTEGSSSLAVNPSGYGVLASSPLSVLSALTGAILVRLVHPGDASESVLVRGHAALLLLSVAQHLQRLRWAGGADWTRDGPLSYDGVLHLRPGHTRGARPRLRGPFVRDCDQRPLERDGNVPPRQPAGRNRRRSSRAGPELRLHPRFSDLLRAVFLSE